MVQKAAEIALAVFAKPVVESIVEKARRRRLTTQDASLLLLYEMNGRMGRMEEALNTGLASLTARLDSLTARLDSLTAEIRGLREDMRPLWSALAELVKASASKK